MKALTTEIKQLVADKVGREITITVAPGILEEIIEIVASNPDAYQALDPSQVEAGYDRTYNRGYERSGYDRTYQQYDKTTITDDERIIRNVKPEIERLVAEAIERIREGK